MVNEPLEWQLTVEELMAALASAHPQAVVALKLDPAEVDQLREHPEWDGSTLMSLRLDPANLPGHGLVLFRVVRQPLSE